MARIRGSGMEGDLTLVAVVQPRDIELIRSQPLAHLPIMANRASAARSHLERR